MKKSSEVILDQIRNQITAYQMNVRSDNKAHRYNINDRAEAFTIPLFKLLFGWNYLRDLNIDQANYPGIDLGDENERVAIQVTSETTLDKVKGTLKKFIEKKYYESFDRLAIFMIQEKQSSYSKKGINKICTEKFQFDPKVDIIDIQDLMKFIKELSLKELKDVLTLFQDETGYIEKTSHNEIKKKDRRTINKEWINLLVAIIAIIGAVLGWYLDRENTITETQESTVTPTKTTSQEIIDFINEEVNIEFKIALGDIDSRWKRIEKYFCSEEAIDNLEAFRKWISRDFGNSIEVEIKTELIKEPIILENDVWEFIQNEIWKFEEEGIIDPKKWETIYEVTKNVDGNYCIYKYDRKVIE